MDFDNLLYIIFGVAIFIYRMYNNINKKYKDEMANEPAEEKDIDQSITEWIEKNLQEKKAPVKTQNQQTTTINDKSSPFNNDNTSRKENTKINTNHQKEELPYQSLFDKYKGEDAPVAKVKNYDDEILKPGSKAMLKHSLKNEEDKNKVNAYTIDNSENEMPDFDLKNAILYSEILKRPEY